MNKAEVMRKLAQNEMIRAWRDDHRARKRKRVFLRILLLQAFFAAMIFFGSHPYDHFLWGGVAILLSLLILCLTPPRAAFLGKPYIARVVRIKHRLRATGGQYRQTRLGYQNMSSPGRRQSGQVVEYVILHLREEREGKRPRRRRLAYPTVPYGARYAVGDELLVIPTAFCAIDLTKEREKRICPFCGLLFPTAEETCTSCTMPILTADSFRSEYDYFLQTWQ